MSITNSIILSAGLFGSIYLCSTTLTLINMAHIENINKKMPNELIILNGLTFIMTGSLVIYTFAALRRLGTV
jgi:hypothetical protein